MQAVWIEHEGKRMRVAMVREGRVVWIGWPGGTARFEPVASVSRQRKNPGELIAPLVAKVVQVKVAPGQEVQAGELLVTLEAMKMEHRLCAPKSGRVASVHCVEGELVEQGWTLVRIE